MIFWNRSWGGKVQSCRWHLWVGSFAKGQGTCNQSILLYEGWNFNSGNYLLQL